MNLFKKLIPYLLIAAVLVSVFAVWKTNPIDYERGNSETISYLKAKVLSVNSQSLEESEGLPGRMKGEQNITVRFTSGNLKGREVTLDNMLSEEHSVEVAKGTKIIVKCDTPENVTPYYTVYEYDRTVGIIAALAVFLVLIVLVGRSKGLKAALALFVSVVLIAGGMLPLLYNGKSAVAVTFVICFVITMVTLLLLNGFSAKTWVAILSTLIGLFASSVFYILMESILSLTGYSLDETPDLIMITRHTGLKLSEILFSGILLSSLGAVMDTAMSIASSLFEILSVEPKMKQKELFASGINIGRDMIGTMCQTLILAFTGSSVAFLLVMLSYNTRFHQFLSSEFLAVELLQALTGSLAVILTVPITAYISASVGRKIFKRSM